MTTPDFTRANHTLIVSDVHLTEAEPPHPGNALWKRYKRPKYFVDQTFSTWLDKMEEEIRKTDSSPIELVLNGDIFDFDAVQSLPNQPKFRISWLERNRGLNSEEPKSAFKMQVILTDHYVWVNRIRKFVEEGNRVVFVIGNHDLELHWPEVQKQFFKNLNVSEEIQANVRFTNWFYISNSDTLIEHGNQYDHYCLCQNPIHPTIRRGRKALVRLPFGDLAAKYIMNGIGLMNPHVESTFIKSSIKEYVLFFYRDMLRVQPFILLSWLWGSILALIVSLRQGFAAPMVDPLTLESTVEDIANRANSTPPVVRSLSAIRVHPAIFNPFMILRELWLDRAILLVVLFSGTFFLFSFLNLFTRISLWWWVVIFLAVLPLFLFYARSVNSELRAAHRAILKRAPLAARVTSVNRVVNGHTHIAVHGRVKDIEVLNTGTWSPAYEDLECTRPYGKKNFAWIRPGESSKNREASLYSWDDPGYEKVQFEEKIKR